MLSFYVGFFGLSYVLWLCLFFKNQVIFWVWVCLTTFLCFIISFLGFYNSF